MRAALFFAALHLGGLALAASSPDPLAAFPRFIAGVSVATAAWLLVAATLLRAKANPPPGILALGIAASIAGRALFLVPTTPLSDDLNRYIWDGRVSQAGINPYIYAPDDPALDALRAANGARVNHPDVPTIYPSLAQHLFRGFAAGDVGPRGVRAWAAAFDLASALVFAAALHRGGRLASLALVQGLCPLAILESAGAGHVDAFAVLLLAAAVYFAPRRAFVAGLFFGGAALVKLVPVALGPAFVLRRSPRVFFAFTCGALLTLVFVLPHIAAGPRLFDGLLAYGEHWRFHDALYSPLVAAGLEPGSARRLLATLFALVALATPFLVRDLFAAGAVVFGAFLVLSPTVHPWYALALVPFLVATPRALLPAAFALVALLPISYVSSAIRIETGAWSEPAWVRAATWVPVAVFAAAGLLVEAFNARRNAALRKKL